MTHHLLTGSEVRHPRNLKDSTGHQTSESPGGHRLLSCAKDAVETDVVNVESACRTIRHIFWQAL